MHAALFGHLVDVFLYLFELDVSLFNIRIIVLCRDREVGLSRVRVDEEVFELDLLYACFAVSFLIIDLYPFEFETECNVVEYVEVGEQRILLKDRIDGAFVRRKFCDIFAAEEHLALRGYFKSRNHSQSRRLSAAARSQEGDEFSLFDIEIYVVENALVAVLLSKSFELNYVFAFFYFCVFLLLCLIFIIHCDLLLSECGWA